MVLVKLAVAFCTAMNFSVCVALCALATAGSTSAPVVPRTTAAPAATMDVRTFMISLLSAGHDPFRPLTDDPPCGPGKPGPGRAWGREE